MTSIIAKIKVSGGKLTSEIFKKVTNTEEEIFEDVLNNSEFEFDKYSSTRIPEDNLWFYIDNFSQKEFADILIKKSLVESELSSLDKSNFDKIEYMVACYDNKLFYQRVTKSKLLKKKGVFWWDNAFTYKSEDASIRFNKYPDAIYDKSNDRLYFKKINAISAIFIGINELYREATKIEVESFLKKDFIICDENYNAESVNVTNRKKIAQVIENLDEFSKEQLNELLDYIRPYCNEIYTSKRVYKITNDKELKQLLDGLCENYYTTPISNQKTLAHSTSKI